METREASRLEGLIVPGSRSAQLPVELLGVFFFTVISFLVMGYHPGLEDDAIYLPGVQSALNPSLFPFNSNFFRLQLEATFFDNYMATFVRITHMPVAWAELFWQITSLFLILWAAKKIANHLFAEEYSRWAGVALVAAMMTLPVAGTALTLMDQHLHPRGIATALILLAVWQVLEKRQWLAVVLLVGAFAMHVLMATMGASFCIFLMLTSSERVKAQGRMWSGRAAAVMPLGWVFEPANRDWQRALDTRTYYYLYKWTWYEWLGAILPLALFWLLWRYALRRGDTVLAKFTLAVFAYGAFQQALAMVLLASPSLVRLTPLQPMRYLHLFYFFFILILGSMTGKHLLKRSAWRWAVFLLATNGCMFASQRFEFPASRHLELPGRQPSNEWLQAFAWIRANTPLNAYFALDPHFMEAPGEDFHGFRGLAERSQLADAVKDAAVVTQVPELGPVWAEQVQAEGGWSNFELADFERLKTQFGVDWVLVAFPAPTGLSCKWHNRTLSVCQIP